MVKKNIILFMLVLSAFGFAQNPDMIYISNGKVSALLLTAAPEFDEQVVIYRRDSGSNQEFAALNAKNTLKQIDDPFLFEQLMGADMESLINFFDAEDQADALRRTLGSSIEASLAAILFPGVAIVSGRMYIDSTAVTGKSYEYKVEYLNYYNKVIRDFTAQVTASVAVPEAPASLSSKITGAVHTLQWEYPKWEENMSNLAVRFNVYRKAGKGSFRKINTNIIIRNDAQPGSFTELIPDSLAEAEYQITAVDPLGNESKPSKSIKVKLMTDELPAIPAGINAMVNKNRIAIVWDYSTDPMVTGYNIYRREGSHGDTVKINKKPIPKETAFFTDSLAKAKVKNYYMVRAISKNGKESRLSSLAVGEIIDQTRPEPPTGFKVNLAGEFVKLEWKPSPSKDTEKYGIYRGESKDLLIKIATVTGTSYIDSGYGKNRHTPGRYYSYTVSAIDEGELESVKKDTVTIRYVDKVAPGAPSPFAAEVLPDYHIKVRAGMTPVRDLAKVNIYRKNIKSSKEELISVQKQLPLLYVDTTAVKLESYIYMAEAIDSSGNKSGRSMSDTIKLVDLFRPAAVPEVTAILKKEGGVDLTWIDVVEKDLLGYIVLRSDLPTGKYTKLNSVPVKEAKYTDPAGKAGHFYRIIAVDTSGNESDRSEYSPVIVLKEDQ